MKTDQPDAAALLEDVAEAHIVLDRRGRCTYVNHQAERLFGKTADELTGRILWGVLRDLARSGLPDECQRAMEDQKPYSFEERDEKGSWWERRLLPAPDGLSLYFANVTARRERDEDLRLSEESYSRLVSSLCGIVWVADPSSFRFQYVSEQAAKILGYPVKQWLEEPNFWVDHLHPEDREASIRSRRDALSNDRDTAFDYRMLAADGREVQLHEIVSPQTGEGGKRRLHGITIEISDRDRREHERDRLFQDLEERIKELATITGVAYLLHRTDLRFEEILRELVLLLPTAFQFPDAAVARVKIGEFAVVSPNFVETPALLRADRRCADGTECRVEAGYSDRLASATNDSHFAQENLVLQFTADLLRLAEDRRQTLEALRGREELFRTLVHTSGDCMAILDETGHILYHSPAIERITGHSPEELLGRNAEELIHPDEKARWYSFLEEAFGKGDASARVEYRWQNRTGNWRVLESTGRRIVDDRGRPAVVISTRDVTDRSELEQRLRDSERRFRLLFEKNAAGMVICDSNFRMWQTNPAFCRLLGYSEEELLRLSILEITHPEDRAESIRVSHEMIAKGKPIEVEKRYLRKDGTTVWVRTSSIPYTTEGTSPCCIATIQDITPSKTASEALRLSEQRYRSLLLASAQVVWITDALGSFDGGTEPWRRLTGQTDDECRGWGWLKAVHRDDRARVARLWAEAIKTKAIYQTEMRIRTVAGEYRDFSVRGAPVSDEAGEVREWVGTCADITDRKRAEADVLTWKNRYDAAVLASRHLLYDWDMASDTVSYGGNTEAVLGYSVEEMKERGGVRRWTDLIHPDDRPNFREHVERVLQNRQSLHVTYRLKDKAGSYRFVEDNGQCYFDKRSNSFRLTGFITDITRRVETEQKLRVSEERFRRIFEECGVGMLVMDLEQHFLQVNPAYCRFLGYSPEELQTMTERELVFPDDLPEYDRLLDAVLRGEQRVFDLDKRCMRKDGAIVWAHLTGVFPSVHGKSGYCVAVVQDITARKQAEEEVRRRDRFFRSLIENSSDNITVLDEHGITLFQSPAIQRQLGYAPEDLVGKNNAELIHPADRPKATRKLLTTLRGGEALTPVTLRFLNKNGSWRILETVGKRFVDDTGHVVGIFNTRDVTERVNANKQVHRAKLQAEAANAAKDRFLAALSHELRTPLTPVVALLPSLIQAPDLPDHMKPDLMMIRQNVELETRLIDDLLDLTRITQNKVSLNRTKIDAHELIRDTLEIVRGDADAKQISLELNLHATDYYICADRVRLQQVFWNLLKNAIKFSPSHSSISVVSENPDPARIRITVQDRGAGIEAEQLPHIFDAFVQTIAGGGHQFGGLGLGLFISRAMVERHAGTIEVESKGLGKGAAFHVTLATVPKSTEPAAEPPVPVHPSANRVLRILLVEDHLNTREVLSRLLRRKGHTVLTAKNVQEALAVPEGNKIDVVVSDLGLPDGSGLDLMTTLRSRYGLKGIAVSGYGMESDLQQSRKAGFNAHLVKPVDFKLLESALHELTASMEKGNGNAGRL